MEKMEGIFKDSSALKILEQSDREVLHPFTAARISPTALKEELTADNQEKTVTLPERKIL